MPRGYPPSIFVSSTCYDLGQIRADLNDFIESIGYTCTISENSSFPVNPQASNFDNCIRAVRDRADILVLVVDLRYGSETHDGRSITSHEFLEAKALGIPVYAFVSQRMAHLLPAWRANPTGDYTGITDSPKLFEFVDSLYRESECWVFEFNKAADIISKLRTQLALLFTEALHDRARLISQKMPASLLALPANVLRIVLEKSATWEYRFFAAALRHELEGYSALRWDVRFGVRFGNLLNKKGPSELCDWIVEKARRMRAMSDISSKIMNTVIQEAVGPPGSAGDAELLLYAAKRLAGVYRDALEWTREFLDLTIHAEFRKMIDLHQRSVGDLIAKIEGLPDLVDSEMRNWEAARSKGETYEANLTIILEYVGGDEIAAEWERLLSLVHTGALNSPDEDE